MIKLDVKTISSTSLSLLMVLILYIGWSKTNNQITIDSTKNTATKINVDSLDHLEFAKRVQYLKEKQK